MDIKEISEKLIKAKNEYKNLEYDIYLHYESLGFTSMQIDQIIYGICDEKDITIFAKKEFSYLQMEQIRCGLRDNEDVSIFAKKEYSPDLMVKIRNILNPYIPPANFTNVVRSEILTLEEKLNRINLLIIES